MGQVTALIFSSFAFLTVLSFGLQRRRRRLRTARLRRLDWARMAQGLFAATGGKPTAPEERLGLMLGEALEELDLTYAMVGLHEQGRMKILHLSSRGYAAPLPFKVGMEMGSGETYAGSFSARSDSIAIDIASISEWRAHPASRKFGWEAYLAVKRPLPNGAYLSLACFAARPRDTIFTASEKRFLQDAAAWGETVLTRAGRIEGAPNVAVPADQSARAIPNGTDSAS